MIIIDCYGESLVITAISFSYAKNSMNYRGLQLMDHYLEFDGIYSMLDFNMPMCNVNRSDGDVPQSVLDFVKVLRDTDILIFAIPEATGHYNSGFKNAMDWLICESKFNSDLAEDGSFYNKPIYVVTFTPVIDTEEAGVGGRHFEMTKHLLQVKMGANLYKMATFNNGWRECLPNNHEWVKDFCISLNQKRKAGDIVFGKRKAGYTLKNRPATWIKQYDQWDEAWKKS